MDALQVHSGRALPTMAAPAAEGDEAALWRRLRTSSDAGAREALLTLHLPYARIVAGAYFRRRFHNEIEFGDYLQYASVGLLEAMERFDPDRGAQFRTFAARRMHGAILNGIERLTEKQQQIAVRQRLRAEQLDAVKELAAERSGMRPGATPRGAAQLMHYMAEVGLGLALGWMLEGSCMVDDPDRSESLPFYRNVEVRQLRDRLLQAVDALPANERTVVRSHYLQDLAFEEVAAMLKLTKGRISQLHRQAMLRLRASMAEDAGLDLRI
jgi:RNA polymerase sigma factor for flagellar operon FliA